MTFCSETSPAIVLPMYDTPAHFQPVSGKRLLLAFRHFFSQSFACAVNVRFFFPKTEPPVRQGRRDARLPCLRARPDRAALFYYRASRTGPVIKWAFGVVARFEWPTLPARSWIAWIYFVAADGNAVRVAPAPRAPPQRPSAVPHIRCATVRAAAPCVLAARGAPTPVPAARASRRWAPWLSIARAASPMWRNLMIRLRHIGRAT